MRPRRARFTDFSIPLGAAGLLAIAAVWGWPTALIIAAGGIVVGIAALAVLSPWRERPRGTTMEVGNRPLLVHLYSPY